MRFARLIQKAARKGDKIIMALYSLKSILQLRFIFLSLIIFLIISCNKEKKLQIDLTSEIVEPKTTQIIDKVMGGL